MERHEMCTVTFVRMRVFSSSVLAAIALVNIVGCDGTRTVEQTVVLRVTAVEDSERRCKSSVSIREYAEPTHVDLQREYNNPGRFDRMSPWTKSVTTNQSNTAKLTVRRTLFAKSKGTWPPDDAYPVQDRDFEVSIDGCDGIESLRLRMYSGSTVQGDIYLIKVLEISDAFLVEPE